MMRCLLIFCFMFAEKISADQQKDSFQHIDLESLKREIKEQDLADVNLVKDLLPTQEEIKQVTLSEDDLDEKTAKTRSSKEYQQVRETEKDIKNIAEQHDIRNINTKIEKIDINTKKTSQIEKTIHKCKEGFSLTKDVRKTLKVNVQKEKKSRYDPAVSKSIYLSGRDIPSRWTYTTSHKHYFHREITEYVDWSAILNGGLRSFLRTERTIGENDEVAAQRYDYDRSSDTGWGQDDRYMILYLNIDYTLSKYVEYDVYIDNKAGDVWLSNQEEEFVEKNKCKEKARKCVYKGKKNIYGKLDIERDCWEWNIKYECNPHPVNTCDYLRKKCTLKNSVCLEYIGGYCKLWEREYECVSSVEETTTPQIGTKDMKLEAGALKHEPQKNDNIQNLVYFKALNEIPLNAEDLDEKNVKIFGGKKSSCDEHLLLCIDCCSTAEGEGWAKSLGLTKCTDDEKLLAKKRNQNKCIFVGKFRGDRDREWWRYTSNFCCFESEFARSVQEAAKDQLGNLWGDIKNPSCRGLTIEEIQGIDFSKIDLSEFLKDIQESFKSVEKANTKLQQETQNKFQNFDSVKEEESFQARLDNKEGSF